MGAGLFEEFPELCAEADEIIGRPVRELCLGADRRLLHQTRYLQPALFTVSALMYLRRAREDGPPEFLIGHSLGEYAALFAAGSLGFADGLRLVRARGEIMGRATGGGMLAVVGLESDRLRAALDGPGAAMVAAGVEIANHNSPDQTVLSGPEDAVRDLADVLRAAGAAKCVLLNVGVAAHSRHMAGAAGEFGVLLRRVDFAEPRVPVVSNVTARPHRPGEIGELLHRHLLRPVRWWDSLRYLREQGVDALVELGPGSVLGKLWAVAEQRLPKGAPEHRLSAGAPEHRLRKGGPEPRPRPVPTITPERLGAASFRARYGLRRAYLVGSAGTGVGSAGLVEALGRAGLMGFHDIRPGTAGSGAPVGGTVPGGAVAGGALLGGVPLGRSGAEAATVDALLGQGVDRVESDHPLGPSRELVRFRCSGAHLDASGRPTAVRHVLARVHGPDHAAAFLSPPADAVLDALVRDGDLTDEEAAAGRRLPVACDVWTDAGSGWRTHTADTGQLLCSVRRVAEQAAVAHGYREPLHVGVGSGVGGPESAAAAFALGADFVVTTGINLCAEESPVPAAVRELLAAVGPADTGWAPAADHFELGARVRVVRRGTLFPARANRLLRLYRTHRAYGDIDSRTRRHIESAVLGRPFEELCEGLCAELRAAGRPVPDGPRRRMALAFRWYLEESARWAIRAEPGRSADYQLRCGPELAEFNRAASAPGASGSAPSGGPDRSVAGIADWIMSGAAELLARGLHGAQL
ncbi:hypothetical protein UK12_05775 [Saccharothrix sp. ST-888]|nr:hypothetical protein UK12_05775 [Saccharothrix sp. ST-888]